MSLAWRHEVPNLCWRMGEPGGHYARAVLSDLWNRVELGTGCPAGMAYASYAGFSAEPALAIWAGKSKGTSYEFSRREVDHKPSVVVGYAMTEKQGGSDLRETQTTARYLHSSDCHGATAHWYELTGHKWFCSVPQSDGFLTLAKVDGGVTCFFLPHTLRHTTTRKAFGAPIADGAPGATAAAREPGPECSSPDRSGRQVPCRGRGIPACDSVAGHGPELDPLADLRLAAAGIGPTVDPDHAEHVTADRAQALLADEALPVHAEELGHQALERIAPHQRRRRWVVHDAVFGEALDKGCRVLRGGDARELGDDSDGAFGRVA